MSEKIAKGEPGFMLGTCAMIHDIVVRCHLTISLILLAAQLAACGHRMPEHPAAGHLQIQRETGRGFWCCKRHHIEDGLLQNLLGQAIMPVQQLVQEAL